MGNLWKIPNQKHPLKFNILKKKFNEYKQDLPLEHLKNNLNKNLLNKEATKKNHFYVYPTFNTQPFKKNIIKIILMDIEKG